MRQRLRWAGAGLLLLTVLAAAATTRAPALNPMLLWLPVGLAWTAGLWWLDAALRAADAQGQALARREAQMRTLADNLPDTVARVDRQSRYLYVNAAVRQAAGLAPGAFLGRTNAELGMPATVVETWDRLFAQVFAGGSAQRVQFDFPGPQGLRTWESLVVPEAGDGGQAGEVGSVLVISRDITERRRLLDALRASEQRLAYLLDQTPAVIYSARSSGNFAATFYSANIEPLLGYRPQDFLADADFWLDRVHPEDQPAVTAALDSLTLATGAAVVEYRFRHRDGRWRWLRDEFRRVEVPAGEAELVGSLIDITDRRHAEDEVRRLAAELEVRVAERTAQLQTSEQRYRRIFDAVPVAIHEQDWTDARRLLNALREEGVEDLGAHLAQHPEFLRQCLRAVRVLKVNCKAAELRGVVLAEGQPRTLEAVFDTPEGAGDFVGELQALWQGQRLYTWQRRQTLPDGRPLNLLLSMSLPALDESTDGTALVCFIDLTEIDRLHAELDATLASVRRVNRELETFTYSVSHDLKAPLRGIDGYGRLLLRDHASRLDAEGRQFLTHIRTATQHMGQLIDDLLAFSRLERRGMALADLPLAPLVHGVVQALPDSPALRTARITLAVPASLQARADAQGLQMALRNLLDNALKFGRPGVPLAIELGGSAQADGRVTLWVRDNGIGFDMRFATRIFEIFQRLHRAEDYPGTGVGLAIVRKAMERMGGTVRADSRPGEGAIFRLELPGSP
ncbi:PAS domain-containing protein [Ideonella sp. DXS22W]|uniref:histidine kinase n=1 Tax=Pseudaquabacterium inlustre TaxID=2984192 RepID=A0ABU9CKH8_9BURK